MLLSSVFCDIAGLAVCQFDWVQYPPRGCMVTLWEFSLILDLWRLGDDEDVNVITIIVSIMTSYCAGTVQMREESESGIRN